MQPAAALDEQRAGAGEVAVGEMLVADRDLNESLQHLAGRRPAPPPSEARAPRAPRSAGRHRRAAAAACKACRRSTSVAQCGTIGQRHGARGARARSPPSAQRSSSGASQPRAVAPSAASALSWRRARSSPSAARIALARRLRTRSGNVGITPARLAAGGGLDGRRRAGRRRRPDRHRGRFRGRRPRDATDHRARRHETLDAAAGDAGRAARACLAAARPSGSRSRTWPVTRYRGQIAQERRAEGQQRAVGADHADADKLLPIVWPATACSTVAVGRREDQREQEGRRPRGLGALARRAAPAGAPGR